MNTTDQSDPGDLMIPDTPATPYVSFSLTTGIFEIKGRSTPEHPIEYYARLDQWVDRYLENPLESTTVKIYFEYFNTSSCKYLLELLRKFIKVKALGKTIAITWYYEEGDEDMRDSGLDFSELLNHPFEILIKRVS